LYWPIAPKFLDPQPRRSTSGISQNGIRKILRYPGLDIEIEMLLFYFRFHILNCSFSNFYIILHNIVFTVFWFVIIDFKHNFSDFTFTFYKFNLKFYLQSIRIIIYAYHTHRSCENEILLVTIQYLPMNNITIYRPVLAVVEF